MSGEPSKRIDIAGKSFGNWTVLRYAGKKKWRCRCVCGFEKDVLGPSLRNGASTSCGCDRMKKMADAKRTHGMCETSIYKIWTQMIQRCTNPNSTAYDAYGGRGITVCKRWLESFENFLADVGPRPSKRHSIDRFPDNQGNYEPTNVRWATPRQQLLNRRNNRRYSFRGESLTRVELCEKYGLNKNTVEKRLRLGWSIEDALLVPIRKQRNK